MTNNSLKTNNENDEEFPKNDIHLFGQAKDSLLRLWIC
jgi:hypothetical protein